jgi:Flp pilus assembly protein TadB
VARQPDWHDPDDYHDPTRGIGGAPPARSALGLRLTLALFGLVTCTAGAIAFAVVGAPAGTVVLAVLAVAALVDAVVVVRRLRRER